MRAWHAATAALVLWIPQASRAADDAAGAARELARKTSAWGRGPITASYRNLSSLPESQLNEIRQEFERDLGVSAEGVPAVEARITLSENLSQFLLVEEARKGDESQVWIAWWMRSQRPAALSGGAAIEKKLLWEQDEAILDVGFAPDGLLVLTPTRILWRRGQSAPQSVAVGSSRPGPRDPRGRLRVNGDRVQAFLPGVQCSGLVQASLAVECRPSEEPWVLESGSRALLLANFTSDRNYFDGRVVAQNGTRKSVSRFYTAAAVEDAGGVTWLLALVDGRTQVLDGALEPLGEIPGWGSDIAGVASRCGAAPAVLATRAGGTDEPDAVQAFSLVNRVATAVTPPVTFSGPVTALWVSNSASAVAVSRDPATGKYEAYALTMVCGP